MDINLSKLHKTVKDKGAWHAAVHGGHKELDMTEQLNNTNNIHNTKASTSESESESHSVMSDYLQPHGLYSPGILQARKLEWVAFPSPGDLPNPWIKLSHKGSPILQFENISSSVLNCLYGPTLTSVHDYWKNHCFDYTDLCQQSNISSFHYAV